jgi:alkanesulfonate monooxygenase SsuD/methylene tetrahydromethanopterin reductase-like flavin-dependent oxidoreductase (luciferase family)
VLAALAAVTERIGLAGTISSTFNEPYEVARQVASLDRLSGGRGAWNVVTSWDSFTGENFRRPVILQAGESDEGRDFAAASADVIFSRYSQHDAARVFYADVKNRLPKFGRTRDQLLILPAAGFVLGDTDAEAEEIAREIRLAQVSPATAIRFLEQLWNTDLSDHDPDGPRPAADPRVSEIDGLVAKGNAGARQFAKDPVALANQWRAKAEAEHLNTRELIIEVTGRQSFIGSPSTVAEEINRFVKDDASDGFIIGSHLVPGGLDPFVDQVVPLLQERGLFRTEYEETTLREHLGLAPLGAVKTAQVTS